VIFSDTCAACAYLFYVRLATVAQTCSYQYLSKSSLAATILRSAAL